MGLMSELEEMKKNLEEMNQEDENEVVDESSADEQEEQEHEEDKTEEQDAEGSTEGADDGEAESSEDEKTTNAAMARMRRELAAAKKLLKESEKVADHPSPAASEPVTQQVPQGGEKDPEPDVNTNPVEWVKWNKRQIEGQLQEINQWREAQKQAQEHAEMVTNAAQELTSYESDFRKRVDDYDHVSEFMVDELKKSFKRISPSASEEQIIAAVQRHVLMESAKFAQQGLNPIEELYHLAKEQYGYSAPTSAAPAKPDMAKVAANRARNAGLASASGSAQRRAPATMEDAVNLSPAEWNKLSAEEKQRIMSGQ